MATVISRGKICDGRTHIDIVDITTKDEIPDKVWKQRIAKENKFINYAYVYA